METIHVNHVNRFPSHMKTLGWILIRYQALPSDTDTRGPAGLLSEADRCGTINTRSSRSHHRRRTRWGGGAREAKSVMCFLHVPPLVPTVPTCARRHRCHRSRLSLHQSADKEENNERGREGAPTFNQGKSLPRFSLLHCQKCCTCLYLLYLTLWCQGKMSALISQNKFLLNAEGREKNTAGCLFCLL